jgi:PAT family beta-lactamase induction signal transducer AmpG
VQSKRSLLTLAAILYFSQGFPFGIVTETLNLYLSVMKVPLAQIGLLSGIGIAWTLKVFWAPLVDLFGTYRAWICGSLVAIAAAMFAIGASGPATALFWTGAGLLAFASATQDIAIDALTIRVTPAGELGPVNSVRVTTYRVAIIAAGGGIAIAAARIGWRNSFFLSALIPIAIVAVILFILPHERGARTRNENPLLALGGWLRRPGSISLLAVVLLYRVGDSALAPMIKPFWIARGFSAAEVGNVTTTLGMICTIAGAIAGGAFVSRFGIFAGLLWLGLVQMLSNLTYAWVAATGAGRPPMYGAAMVETFCGGLGVAAFLSFLMFVCDKENAATEYAMLSAVFGLTRTIAGAVSGFYAQKLGFAPYFMLTAALALPGMALLPLIRERVRGDASTIAAAIDA